MHAESAPVAVPHANAPAKPRGVPLSGFSDLQLRLPVRLQVRLAAESILTGRSADELATLALELYLAATQAKRESN